MEKTPIKLNFQPTVAVEEPFKATIDTTETLTLDIPKQVVLSFNNFVLVWTGGESTLKEVDSFSGDPLEYKQVDESTLELPSEFRDQKVAGEATFRFDHANGNSTRLTKPLGEYFMVIRSPSSIGKIGIEQAFPQNATVLIPADGKLSLELMPTSDKYPIGRYKVEYYHKDKPRRPVDVQYWAVPPKPYHSNIRLTTPIPPDTPIDLPHNFHELLSLSIEGYSLDSLNWIVDWNQFQFIEGQAPETGHPFEIAYQPALTLGDVVDYDLINNPYHGRYAL